MTARPASALGAGPPLPGRRRTPLLSLALDRGSATALQQQLYDQLREVILAGGLAPGSRLPSSRALAAELGCSRNTVVTAFDQLLSEGYLEGQAGSGTFVSRVLPEDLLGLAPARPGQKEGKAARETTDPKTLLSARGQALTALRRRRHGPERAFLPGIPETMEFPFDIWTRLHSRLWRHPSASLLRLGTPAGLQTLREAIARYLATFRGMTCDWRQVIVTTGAQQALDMMIQLLLEPGDRVWIEEPGYPGIRGPLIAAAADPVPLPLDGEGLMVSQGRRRAPSARAAIVTPTHHYPLGTTMSLARRLELLEWAREAGAWILEDDYDSEYRYAGRPLASLWSLAAGREEAARVIYVGSFSKVLFPSIRIGYLVVPESLIDAASAAQSALGTQPTAVLQPVLAAFIEEGHFATHVRRMRRLYAARQAALVAAAERHLAGLLEVPADDAGLHLMAWLAPELAARLDDRAVTETAAEAGVAISPLSDYFMGKPDRQGLLLGYAAVPEDEIEIGARRLGEALRASR
ncbi:PLP-dependent aminotransferase family protein [Pelagibius marinus]|uniref:MocR-like pyridoxine biosynthesis transcription factor PdxR n=1 Tax=Pelagibius marinus TaxID=2762760 RepID=UPI001872687D|nr:PLP-dependent aminotransferase family protein [Pelagibius marinus]